MFLTRLCSKLPYILLGLLLFFLPLQTRWIIKLGTLKNLPWEFSTISLYGTDLLIILFLVSVVFGTSRRGSKNNIVRACRELPKTVKNYFRRIHSVIPSQVEGSRIAGLPRRLRLLAMTVGQRTKNLLLTTSILVPLVLWSLASILWSPDKPIALYQAFKLLEGVLLFGAIKIVIARKDPSLVIASQAKQSDIPPSSRAASRDLAFVAFTLAVVIQAALGSWQFLTQHVGANKWLGMAVHDPWQSGASVVETLLRRWLRGYGTLPHPNILGEYLVVGLLLWVLLMILWEPRMRQRAFSATTRTRFLLWTVATTIVTWVPWVVLVSGLFFTFSRAAWLVFFLSIGFLLLSSRVLPLSFRAKPRDLASQEAKLLAPREVERSLASAPAQFIKLFLIAVIIFLTLGLTFRDPTTTRLTAHGRLETKSTTERLGGYTRAWESIKQRPILGTGIGQSSLLVPELVEGIPLDKKLPASVAVRSLEAAAPIHNTPLLVFVELGFIGGLLYLAFLLLLLRQAFRSIIQNSPTVISSRSLVIPSQAEGSRPLSHKLPVTNYQLLAAGALAALVVLSLADHSFWTLHAGQMLFWGVAGLAAASIPQQRF